MDRRQYVAGISGVVGLGVSGCLGNDSGAPERQPENSSDSPSGDSDNSEYGAATTPDGIEHDIPEIEAVATGEARYQIIDKVVEGKATIEEPIVVHVAIANVGDEAGGEEEIQVGVARGEEYSTTGETNVTVSGLPSTEWVSKRLEFDISTPTEWMIQSSVEVISQVESIDVDPVFAAKDEPITAYDGATIRVLETRTEQMLLYDSPDVEDSDTEYGPGVLEARQYDTMQVIGEPIAFVVSHIEVEATGGSEISIGRVSDGSDTDYQFQSKPLPMPAGLPEREAFRVDGDILSRITVQPGETVDFWDVTYTTPELLDRGEVGFSLLGDESPWGGSSTDIVLTDELPESNDLAEFELRDYSVSGGSGDAVLQMTVENIGGTSATFRGAIGTSGYRELHYPNNVETQISSGDAKQFELEIPSGESSYRLEPFGVVFNV